MIRAAGLLRQAREAAGLTADDLGAYAGLAPDVVRAIEEGDGAGATELDACARVFGLRLDDLLRGEAGKAPMTLFFRGLRRESVDLRTLLTTEVHLVFGEFQRVVRDVAELEARMGHASRLLPSPPTVKSIHGEHRGDYRSRRVRALVGRGPLEPIPSIRALCEELGVALLFVPDEDGTLGVDGACVRSPRPAILANVGKPGSLPPWRFRTTVAHELGHLFFDMTSPSRQALISRPAGGGGAPAHSELPRWLDEIERTADAFAACLLAPTEGVRQLGASAPTSERSVRVVGETYGVGYTLAVNRLRDVFNLTQQQRQEMMLREDEPYAASFAGDAQPEHIGLRGEPLRSLVRSALAANAIPASRARKLLRLAPTAELPFPDLGDVCAPVLAPENLALRHAYAHLSSSRPDESLIARAPEREGKGFRIPIEQASVAGGVPRDRGYLVVAADGSICEDRVSDASES